MRQAIARAAKRAAASATRSQRTLSKRGRRSDHKNGATISTPIASPVHQTAHVSTSSRPSIAPATSSVVVPTVALIAMHPSAPMNTSTSASRTRSRWMRKPTRASARAATTGASVFPAPIKIAAPHRWTDRHVDREGGDGDRGPDPRAEGEQGHDGHSGRRPERCDLVADDRESEPEFGGHEVHDRDDGEPDRILPRAVSTALRSSCLDTERP